MDVLDENLHSVEEKEFLNNQTINNHVESRSNPHGVTKTDVGLGSSTSSHTKPSDSFVNEIQEQIDPVQNHGAGFGIAPIGHTVTVVGVAETTVNVSMTLTLQGKTIDDVKPYVIAAVDKYFSDINAEWDSVQNIIIRVSQLETRILDIPGIVDISNVVLNDAPGNLILDKDSLAKRGTVNAN